MSTAGLLCLQGLHHGLPHPLRLILPGTEANGRTQPFPGFSSMTLFPHSLVSQEQELQAVHVFKCFRLMCPGRGEEGGGEPRGSKVASHRRTCLQLLTTAHFWAFSCKVWSHRGASRRDPSLLYLLEVFLQNWEALSLLPRGLSNCVRLVFSLGINSL